jgi:hypothetical protein
MAYFIDKSKLNIDNNIQTYNVHGYIHINIFVRQYKLFQRTIYIFYAKSLQ